jgi:hypothetical protein
LIGIGWRDIDFKNSKLSITQTLKPRNRIKNGGKTDNAIRSISISPLVVTELKKHRKMMIQERLATPEYEDMDLVVCQPN